MRGDFEMPGDAERAAQRKKESGLIVSRKELEFTKDALQDLLTVYLAARKIPISIFVDKAREAIARIERRLA